MKKPQNRAIWDARVPVFNELGESAMAVNRSLKKKNAQNAHIEVPRLKALANENFRLAEEALSRKRKNARKYMKYVKACGEALFKVRFYNNLTRNKHWKPWLEENFDGKSVKMATRYIHVHKNWEAVQEKAKKAGIKIESIRCFEKVWKDKHPAQVIQKKEQDDPTKNWSVEKKNCDTLKNSLKKRFGQALNRLFLEELQMFDENFNSFWTDLYAVVYDSTCRAIDYDYNEFLHEIGKLDTEEHNKPDRKKMSRIQISRLAEKIAKKDMQIPNKLDRLTHAMEVASKREEQKTRMEKRLPRHKRKQEF
ncbi:MAG: hypothetical protein C0397_19505 [Odoribacter sp.]|nr:hypothetical protein [Odoribacter sp.]